MSASVYWARREKGERRREKRRREKRRKGVFGFFILYF